MNILLQGAGGPASHGVIKSLREIDFEGKIVSVDANPLSVGFHLSDESYNFKCWWSGWLWCNQIIKRYVF